MLGFTAKVSYPHENPDDHRRQSIWKIGIIAGICGLVVICIIIAAVISTPGKPEEPAGYTAPVSPPDEQLQTQVFTSPVELSNISNGLQTSKPTPVFVGTKQFLYAHWKIILPIFLLLVILVTAITVPIVLKQKRISQEIAEAEERERLRLEELERQQNVNAASLGKMSTLTFMMLMGAGFGLYIMINVLFCIYVSKRRRRPIWESGELLIFFVTSMLTTVVLFILLQMLLKWILKVLSLLSRDLQHNPSALFLLKILRLFFGVLYTLVVIISSPVLLLASFGRKDFLDPFWGLSRVWGSVNSIERMSYWSPLTDWSLQI